jgi:hypothetical protein
MKNHWKDRVRPNLNHIMSMFDRPEVGAFITGHLILESVLVQLIELKKTGSGPINLFDLSFPSKVEMARSRGLVGEKMGEFLLEMNAMRNRIAHRLGEQIDFDRMYLLAKTAQLGEVEFSDDTIHMDKAAALEQYGLTGIIQEVFQNAAQELSFIMEEHGGEFQFA